MNRFNDRAMNLEWIFIMTPSRARKSFSKASPYYFWTDQAGLRRGQIQCRSIISRDFRRFSRTRFTRWIFCIFNRRRPLSLCGSALHSCTSPIPPHHVQESFKHRDLLGLNNNSPAAARRIYMCTPAGNWEIGLSDRILLECPKSWCCPASSTRTTVNHCIAAHGDSPSPPTARTVRVLSV